MLRIPAWRSRGRRYSAIAELRLRGAANDAKRPGLAIPSLFITGITTAVIMVVTAISPHDAWRQPTLRLVDTVVGVAVGVAASWIRLRVTWRATPLTRPGPGARREAQGSIAPGASDATASRRVASAVVWLCSVAESFVTGPIRRRNIAKMATLGWKGPTVFWPRRQRSITPLVRKELQ